ncbi:exosortase A [Paraglaciecola sp. 2405UD69-4]|uniref:exosortase A n=1 Tax=Paraglaciecola sp. 2405UD69-4 TaxID=3391836 RepID=UPI0039C95861
MNGSVASNIEASQVKSMFFGLALIIGCWVFVYWEGIKTAVDIWLVSEIFNHCLFVLPGTVFLIYLKRDKLSLHQVKPNYLVLLLCFGSLFLYAIGLAGDVQLFMHVATFTFLPFALWAYLGNKIALQLLFPLFFILFCIPVGEELIPTLQEVTADYSMVMLNWTNIPVYRSGLYIEIPQGRFLVAEACSGISFFIASIVIGSLYSYLNIRGTKRRIVFMCISIVFPIIANAIRVFGIILTGYLTDMEHAVGADHLVYGWVFFSLVIVCLLSIGELIREKQKDDKETHLDAGEVKSTPVFKSKSVYTSALAIVLVMFLFWFWYKGITSQLEGESAPTKLNFTQENVGVKRIGGADWQPEFIEPFQETQFISVIDERHYEIYLVWYPKGHGELISSLNRLYSEKSWSLENAQYFNSGAVQNLALDTIVNPDSKRLLVHWYLIDGKIFTNKRNAKLYEIYRILMGSYVGSGLVAVSLKTDNVSILEDKVNMKIVVQENMQPLSQYFDFSDD